MANLSNINNKFLVTTGGDVGIGTTSPGFALDVHGDSTAGVLSVKNAANGRDTFRSENAAGTRTTNIGNDGSGHGNILIRNSSGTTTNYISGSGNSYFNAGNVGIGEDIPLSSLHVSGPAGNRFTEGLRVERSTVPAQFAMFNYNGGSLNIIATNTAGTGTSMKFQKSNDGSALIDQMVIDSSGNVGIGVTPFAHTLGTSASLDLKGNGGIWGYTGATYVNSNAYYNSGWKYKTTAPAAVLQVGGSSQELTFRQAVSGTAGNAITYTQPFTINTLGNVGIGEINVDARLHITALASSGISNIKLESPGASKWAFGIPAGQTYFALDDTNDNLSTPKLVVLKTSGNVGIGTDSPQRKLQVTNSADGFISRFTGGANSDVNIGLFGHSTSNFGSIGTESDDRFSLFTNGVDRLNIANTGSVGIGTISPAASAKLTVMGNQTFGLPGNGTNTSGRFISIEGNTDGSGEGSSRIFFTEHNSTTGLMDNYGMSLGYRGGATSIVGASGNTWTGLTQIGNGQWGMWGHNNSATGTLVMSGDRAATYVLIPGQLGVGVTSFTSGIKFEVGGAIRATGNIEAGKNVFQDISGKGGYIMRPWGADYLNTTTNVHTGAIKITLPTGATGEDDMIKFTIDIYQYSTNESLSVDVGGYVYQAAGNNDSWRNVTAIVNAKSATENYTVRFGDDGTNHCVWVGELNTVWNHPNVICRDFYGGFAVETEDYLNEWDVGFEATSFSHVSQTQSNNFPLSVSSGGSSPWTTTGNDIYNNNTGSVGIQNTTPSSHPSNRNTLVVGSGVNSGYGTADAGITIFTAPSVFPNQDVATLAFASNTSSFNSANFEFKYLNRDNNNFADSEPSLVLYKGSDKFIGITEQSNQSFTPKIVLQPNYYSTNITAGNLDQALVTIPLNSGLNNPGVAIYGDSQGNSNPFIGMVSTSSSSQITTKFIRFYHNTTLCGTIQKRFNANEVQYLTTSDYRLKEDLKPFKALDTICKINVYNYKWKDIEGYNVNYGVLAHELQELIPEVVAGEKDEVNKKGEEEYQSVDYSKLVPHLIQSIQELKAEIELLKSK